ncbi:hypothetical protein EJB05_14646 [Eragrostis curvula]|uniref:Uncharacterized protein n=1 Tax=Eragrostis curvula TaxID=38414 RepID=A0A5J9VZ16_9POAL|nr:hypothetical protein EJB05_14646 [Eragrostis curvula]
MDVEFLKAWALALAAVGLLAAAIRLALWVYAAFLQPGKPLRRRYGAWAVVTGATEHRRHRPRHGLPSRRRRAGPRPRGTQPGQARRGGRRDQGRRHKEEENVLPEVRTFVLDFAGEGLAAGVVALEEAVRGLDVGALVNSAGVSYPYARYFHEVDEELMRSLIRVNIEAVTRVTHAVLPGMVDRKSGAIVNIGSGAASVVPSDPLYSVYAATKAYVDQFSRCLYIEYKSKGIDVQCQVPLYVATKMASIRKSSFMVPSADTYARAAVRHIGYEPRSTPYWPHSVMWFLISMLPESLADSVCLNMCIKIRKKGQAKDAKKKAQ